MSEFLILAGIWLITLSGCSCYFFSMKGITKGTVALSLLFSTIPLVGQCMAFIGLCIILWDWE